MQSMGANTRITPGQDPKFSLDPVMRVGAQAAEAMFTLVVQV